MTSKYPDNDDLQHIQRFSDFSEPCTMLMPIQGYEKKPLVTIEEAVEPLVRFVPDVKRMTYVAKTRCKKLLANNLSIDESASIMLYSMEWEPQEECLYFVLNATLRSENRKQLVPWFLYLKLILTAFDRLPSSHRFVYRGIKCDMRKDYPKGETIIWWGFTSCTTTMDVLENEQFLGSTGTRTFFTIECRSGIDIRQHSTFQKEDEILLPPGRQFKVVSCLKQSGGLYMIQLQETEPPYPLLEPVSKDVTKMFSAISAIPPSLVKSISSLTLSNIKTKSEESNKTSSLSSPPTYTNTELQQIINQEKSDSNVRLSDQKLTCEDMEIVAYYTLRNNTTVTELKLHNNLIGDKGVQHLCNALQTNKTLTELTLYINQIGERGAQYLSDALLTNKTLTHLYLFTNQIGHKGAQYLSNALQTNKTLTTLYIDNNEIGDKGAQHLSDALQTNKTLTELSLSDNQIGDRGAQYLSDVLQTNKTLAELSLSDNQIGDKGRQLLDKLKIKNGTLKLSF